MAEGEYFSYNVLWSKNSMADWGVINGINACELCVYENIDKIIFLDGYSPQLIDVKLSDGSLNEFIDTLTGNGYSWYRQQTSVYKRYFVYIYNNGGQCTLRIYKDGIVIQTIDLTALYGWTYDYYQVGCCITQDAKYITVWNDKAGAYQGEIKLFKGE